MHQLIKKQSKMWMIPETIILVASWVNLVIVYRANKSSTPSVVCGPTGLEWILQTNEG